MEKYVIGIDFGSDSCRGIVVSTKDGHEVAESVFYYPRWKKGLYCDPAKSQYRQHPLDYIEGIDSLFGELTAAISKDVCDNIVGISVDTTGSTPCIVDETGMPLALRPEFAENPNAMFILWKDHTSVEEAELITATAKNWGGVDYTQYIGGVYSSEWYFAKLLHVFREDKSVKDAYVSFVEHCDFVPAYLTGVSSVHDVVRGRCSAGHKGMWHEDYDGLPAEDFLVAIDPLLKGVRDSLYVETFTAEKSVGTIRADLAEKYGLPQNIQVGGGAFDCHIGAVGGNIHTNALVKVIGTSTCDIVIKDNEEVAGKLIEGICGQVDGSVVSGKLGMEAGQSAFGDFYAWYKRLISWPLRFVEDEAMREKVESKLLYELEKVAAELPPSDILTIDWINGRRTPYANQKLKAAIMGLDLSSDAPRVYRSIIEATVYGAKAIADRFKESGIELTEIIAIGGVAKKSKLAMQIMADVCDMKVLVAESEQAVALGAAIFASVAGGVYETIEEAQKHMASKVETVYTPNPEMVAVYKPLYENYLKFGDILEKEFYS